MSDIINHDDATARQRVFASVMEQIEARLNAQGYTGERRDGAALDMLAASGMTFEAAGLGDLYRSGVIGAALLLSLAGAELVSHFVSQYRDEGLLPASDDAQPGAEAA